MRHHVPASQEGGPETGMALLGGREAHLEGGRGRSIVGGQPGQRHLGSGGERAPDLGHLLAHEMSGHEEDAEHAREKEDQGQEQNGDEGDEQIGHDELAADPPEQGAEAVAHQPEGRDHRVCANDDRSDARESVGQPQEAPEHQHRERTQERAAGPGLHEEGSEPRR